MSPEKIARLAPAVFLIPVAAYIAAELALCGRLGPPLDDGWIYMAFARSLAAGDGVTYPGHDGAVAAVTGPAWCALMAALFWLFGASVLLVKLLGVATGCLAILGVFRLGRAATGDAGTAAAAALLCALSPRLVWGALSGMEVPLYVGAVAFGLALHLERRRDPLARWLPAALVLVLAGWARPECFVFVVIAAFDRRRLWDIAVVVALLLPYPAYHLCAYGHPLPTTFYAKAAGATPFAVLRQQGAWAALLSTGQNTLLELASFASYLPTFLPLVVPGFLVGLRRGMRQQNGIPFVAMSLGLFIVARGALGYGPPWFQHGRYFAHAWPLFALVCVYGMDLRRTSTAWALAALALCGTAFALAPKLALLIGWDWLDKGIDIAAGQLTVQLVWLPAAAFAALAVAALLLVRTDTVGRPPLWALLCWLVPALALGALRYGAGVRDTYALNVAMAEQVRSVVPVDDVVACHDIGALGYFAERRLLDLAGLGSPDVVFRPRAPGAPVDIPALLAERRVRWLCLTDQMADVVNPSARRIPGLTGTRLRATITWPDNVTVHGSTYHLIELTWE